MLEQFRNIDFGGDEIYLFSKTGEHYNLLAKEAMKINNSIIFDIGTYRCVSAFALSVNPSNYIISYDIKQALPKNPKRENIEYNIGNVFEDSSLFDSKLILVDVDHSGKFEREIYDLLLKNKWHGTIIFDDIYLNIAMKEFWMSIKEPKEDATERGHYTGTGIVRL